MPQPEKFEESGDGTPKGMALTETKLKMQDNQMPDSMKDDDKGSHYKFGIFYFNPADKRPFPPKRYGTGWGVNWANPYALLLMLIIIGSVIADVIYQVMKSK